MEFGVDFSDILIKGKEILFELAGLELSVFELSRFYCTKWFKDGTYFYYRAYSHTIS